MGVVSKKQKQENGTPKFLAILPESRLELNHMPSRTLLIEHDELDRPIANPYTILKQVSSIK